jgi:hypothetical protein
MIKPSPNPPPHQLLPNPVTRAVRFGHCPVSNLLFSVRADIPLENALIHASDHLRCAALPKQLSKSLTIVRPNCNRWRAR